MPTDAVWVIITIPRKEYEFEIKKLRFQNTKNNLSNIDERHASRIYRVDEHPDQSFEKILANALDELQVQNVVWLPTRGGNHFQVYFPCELSENDTVLQHLRSKGIGVKPETSVGYIPFNLFFYEENSDSGDDEYDTVDNNNDIFGKRHPKKPVKAFKQTTNQFLQSVTSRLTVAQVVEGVRSGAEITFDWCVYLLMAGFICAFGLMANDPVNIAASMMIEPVMGTVMAMTFGLVIHDKKLFFLGLKNNIISLIICGVIGYVIGLIALIWMTQWNPPPAGIWPTAQMQSRGTYEGLIYGVMIALPCGGAVAVSLLNSNFGALVGVAVASTFQPPFINAGFEWALCTHLQIRGHSQIAVPYNISGTLVHLKPAWAPQQGYNPVYSYDMRVENALLGCVSMALSAVNVISMLIVAYITLRIKEVMPLDALNKLSPGTKRFFRQDIKFAREYNRRSHNNDDMGQQIIKEWVEINGLDQSQIMSQSPQAKITRLQTLYDLVRDVEADETYRRVMGYSIGNQFHKQPPLLRRLTRPYLMDEEDEGQAYARGRNPAISTIERELTRAMSFTRSYDPDRSKIINESANSSPSQSIGRSGRGYRPSDLRSGDGRRSSHALRSSLRRSDRSPYSIWPKGQTDPQHRPMADEYEDEHRLRYRNIAHKTNDTQMTNF